MNYELGGINGGAECVTFPLRDEGRSVGLSECSSGCQHKNGTAYASVVLSDAADYGKFAGKLPYQEPHNSRRRNVIRYTLHAPCNIRRRIAFK